MYLHLGQGTVVRTKDLVGIFDMDKTTISRISRQFLADAQKGGRVVNVTGELPKSYVVCVDKDKNETVYISQLSPSTLRRRAGLPDGLAEDAGGRAK